MGVEIEAEVVKKYVDKAKIQEIGKDTVGRPRFMIYITAIAREAGFKKGDILVVSVNKIGHQAPRSVSKDNINIGTDNLAKAQEYKAQSAGASPSAQLNTPISNKNGEKDFGEIE